MALYKILMIALALESYSSKFIKVSTAKLKDNFLDNFSLRCIPIKHRTWPDQRRGRLIIDDIGKHDAPPPAIQNIKQIFSPFPITGSFGVTTIFPLLLRGKPV